MINRDGRSLREFDILIREKDVGISSEDIRKDVFLRWKYNFLGSRYEDVYEVDKEMSRIEDDYLLERGNMDIGNDVLEIFMVDIVLEMDIFFDDVVEVLGRKYFWKVRIVIVK